MIKLLSSSYILLILLSSHLALAEANFGKKLQLKLDNSNSPAFGVQYAKRNAQMVSITFSVRGSELVGNSPGAIATSQWSIFNKLTGSQMTSWKGTGFPTATIAPESSQVFNLAIDDIQEVTSVINSFNSTVIAIAINPASQNPTSTLYLDLQELCSSVPNKFLNLDTLSAGCN